MTAGSTDWLIGKYVGGFELVEHVGAGAFADVYRGVRVRGTEPVAVKVLRPGANASAQLEFENEGVLLEAARPSRAVVDHLASGQDQVDVAGPIAIPVQFHVLEFAAGSLGDLLARRIELAWQERLNWLRNICLGIHQLQLGGICHRDLKASNCLLFERPFNQLEAKVSDLGRSRRLASAPIGHNYVVGRGDPTFAPPEMLWLQGSDTSEAHVAADLYGVGSLLFEAATGQGLTAIAFGPAAAMMLHHSHVDPSLLARMYQSEIPELRSKINSSLGLLEAEVPKAIVRPYKELIRNLTDPDPKRRVHSRLTGRREPGLLWVLNRLDILRRILAASEHDHRKRR